MHTNLKLLLFASQGLLLRFFCCDFFFLSSSCCIFLVFLPIFSPVCGFQIPSISLFSPSFHVFPVSFQIYCSSTEDTQQPTPAFFQLAWRALCQGQTLSESSWVATNHVQIVHIWPWSICKSCTFLLGITSCATARRASLVAAKARFLGSAALEDTEMPNHDQKSMPRHC